MNGFNYKNFSRKVAKFVDQLNSLIKKIKLVWLLFKLISKILQFVCVVN